MFIHEEKEEKKKITRKSKSVTEYAFVQQQKMLTGSKGMLKEAS